MTLRPTAAALPLALALTACATTARGPDPVRTQQAITAAARQVKACYRAPRLSAGARQIVVKLRVRLTPDGALAAPPIVVGQSGITPANQVFAGQMAAAAVRAVELCAPLRLPPDLWAGGWDSFDLTFSPGAQG